MLPRLLLLSVECKRCSRCGTRKPRTLFSYEQAAPDGLHRFCKACDSQRHRERMLQRPLCPRCQKYHLRGTRVVRGEHLCRWCWATMRTAPLHEPTKAELAWAVAWFDGEGCVLNDRWLSPQFQITQKSPEVLSRLRDFLGGSVSNKPKRDGTHQLRIYGEWARKFLIVLRDHPLLSSKRHAEVERVFLNLRLRLWVNDNAVAS